MIKVGSDVVVFGSWMQIEEIFDSTTGLDCDSENSNAHCFAVDQNGNSREISMGDIDHEY